MFQLGCSPLDNLDICKILLWWWRKVLRWPMLIYVIPASAICLYKRAWRSRNKRKVVLQNIPCEQKLRTIHRHELNKQSIQLVLHENRYEQYARQALLDECTITKHANQVMDRRKYSVKMVRLIFKAWKTMS